MSEIFVSGNSLYTNDQINTNELDIDTLENDVQSAVNDIAANLALINTNITNISNNDTDIATLQNNYEESTLLVDFTNGTDTISDVNISLVRYSNMCQIDIEEKTITFTVGGVGVLTLTSPIPVNFRPTTQKFMPAFSKDNDVIFASRMTIDSAGNIGYFRAVDGTTNFSSGNPNTGIFTSSTGYLLS